MSRRVWRKGPPPHVGWWNASVQRDHEAWRWWDGKRWSNAAFKGDRPKSVAEMAATPSGWGEGRVEWTDYWPKNARVPRVAP